MALTFGEISAITQKYFVPKLVDNIFNSNALFQRWRKKNYRKIGGGTTVMVPLLYAATTAAGRYSGADSLDTTANDQITSAEFDWRQYYANITITRRDELQNSGKEQIVNFVKSKVQAAEKTLADTIGTDLFGDGSTADAIKGIQLICDVTGTYGGIAKATYSWWQAQQDTSTTALTMAAFQGLNGDCTVDNDKPTVAVTTQDIYDKHNCPSQRELCVALPEYRLKTSDGSDRSVNHKNYARTTDKGCQNGMRYSLVCSYNLN